MAQRRFVKGLGAQRPFDQGVTEAMLAGYGLLGKKAPAYVALPALPVTKANLLDAWQTGLPRAADRQDQEEHGLTRRGRPARAGRATAAWGRGRTISQPGAAP